jgi:hypothetical protein
MNFHPAVALRALNSETAQPWAPVSAEYDPVPVRHMLIIRTRGTKQRYNRRLVRRLYRNSVEIVFAAFVADWISETSIFSSISSMKRHPLFARLVDLGPDAAKLVFERMKKGDIRLHWFPLLQEITKEDPVPVHSRGRLHEMADAWITRGRELGLCD